MNKYHGWIVHTATDTVLVESGYHDSLAILCLYLVAIPFSITSASLGMNTQNDIVKNTQVEIAKEYPSGITIHFTRDMWDIVDYEDGNINTAMKIIDMI